VGDGSIHVIGICFWVSLVAYYWQMRQIEPAQLAFGCARHIIFHTYSLTHIWFECGPVGSGRHLTLAGLYQIVLMAFHVWGVEWHWHLGRVMMCRCGCRACCHDDNDDVIPPHHSFWCVVIRFWHLILQTGCRLRQTAIRFESCMQSVCFDCCWDSISVWF